MGRGFLLSTRRSHVSSKLIWQRFVSSCHIQANFNVSVPKSESEKFSWSTHVKFVPACIFPYGYPFSLSAWQYVPPLQPNHKASKPNSFSSSTWGLNIKTGRDKKRGGVNVRGPCSSRPRFRSVLAPSRRLMTWGLATTVVAEGSCRSSEVVVREGIAMESCRILVGRPP